MVLACSDRASRLVSVRVPRYNASDSVLTFHVADRSFNLYKASLSLGLGFSRRPSTSASERIPDMSLAELGPRADASFDRHSDENPDTSLPVVRQARRNERAGDDARADRMTLASKR